MACTLDSFGTMNYAGAFVGDKPDADSDLRDWLPIGMVHCAKGASKGHKIILKSTCRDGGVLASHLRNTSGMLRITGNLATFFDEFFSLSHEL
ncbi:hypothetical protein Tco_1474217 [Tanacetum coccineum]